MQTVLSDLEFNQWVLRVELKDLGGFWVKGYYHTAPTGVFPPEDRDELERVVQECEKKPVIQKLKRRTVGEYYPVIQLDVPIRLMGPRHYSLTQLKDFFSRNQLSDDGPQNDYLQEFGRRMTEFLITDFKKEKKLKKFTKEKSVLEIEDLRDFLTSRPQIRKAPKDKRERYEWTIDTLLSFLEKGHPLNCRPKKDRTPKVSIPGPLPEEFIKGYYTEGAEQNIAPEGSIVDVSSKLETLLDYRNTVGQGALNNFSGAVETYLSSRKLKNIPANLTRIKNSLEDYFTKKNGKNGTEEATEIIKTLGGQLTPEVINSWKELQQVTKNMTILGKDFGGLEVRVNYQKPELELWFEKDPTDQIEFVRMRTAEDIRKEIWWLIDWENFEFNTEHAGISMGAMGYLKNLEFYCGVIKARYPVGLEKVGQFAVCDNFSSAEEIVHQTRDEFRKSRASIAVAYNATYDLIEPRKYGDFSIGSLEREPRKVSTVPFFERIGIPAKDVLDPFKLARILYDFLPNRKLVTVAKKIDEEESLGFGEDSLEKIINYRHGRELEIGRRTKKWDHLSHDTRQILEKFHGKKFEDIENKVEAAGQLQAYYVAQDLEKLVGIIKSQRFQKCMDDVSFVSQLSQVDFFLLMHDPKRLDRWLNRIYFQKFGTWRAEMMPRFKNITDAEERAQNYFSREKDKLIPNPQERGMFEQVYKTHLPLGRLFRKEIYFFMKDFKPELDQLFGYIDQHHDDPLRSHFLSKFENAVFDWLYRDYMFYCHTEHRYQEMRDRFVPKGNDYLDREHGLFSILEHRIMFSAAEDKNKALLKKVLKGQLDQESIGQAVDFFGKQFIQDLHLEPKELQSLFNLWIHKNNQKERIRQVYGTTVDGLEKKFGAVYQTLLQYLEDHQLKIVHKQNNFLYLQGDKSHLTNPDSPLILVDELEKVFLTEHPSGRRKNPDESDKKIYYPRCGFWEGIKDEEETTFRLNLFEMSVYSTFLEELFAGHKDRAVEELSLALDAMAGHKVPLEQLVWYSKSKKQYHAFEIGKKILFSDSGSEEVKIDDKTQKPYFLKETKNGTEKIWLSQEKETSRYFYEETSSQRQEDDFGKGRYVPVKKKIYLMPLSEFKPDWKTYSQRFSERAEIFLEPLLGKYQARKLVEESQRMARNFLGEEDVPEKENLPETFALTPPEIKKSRDYHSSRGHRKPKKAEDSQPFLPLFQK